MQYLHSDGVYTDVYTCQNIHIRYVQFYVNSVSIKFILKEEEKYVKNVIHVSAI